MQVLEIGKPFKMFEGKDIIGKDGCVFECLENHSYALAIYLSNMSDSEISFLRFEKVTCRIIEEGDFLLTLVRFGNSELIFEMAFDPTLYKDQRMDNMLKSNMLNLIGIESTTNIIKTLRMANLPIALYRKMITIWGNAKDIENYSQKYTNWMDDLDKRYSVWQLRKWLSI
jgi:hypothetical protein